MLLHSRWTQGDRQLVLQPLHTSSNSNDVIQQSNTERSAGIDLPSLTFVTTKTAPRKRDSDSVTQATDLRSGCERRADLCSVETGDTSQTQHHNNSSELTHALQQSQSPAAEHIGKQAEDHVTSFDVYKVSVHV
jgi:hypothetical protein